MTESAPVGIDENGRLPFEAREALAADLSDPETEVGAAVAGAVGALSDPAVASLIDDTESATNASLSATIAEAISAEGVVNDGVVAAAIDAGQDTSASLYQAVAGSALTYEWSGTPHASTSLAKRDGVTVRENLCANSSVETALTPFVASAGSSAARDDEHPIYGDWAIRHTILSDGTEAGTRFVYAAGTTTGVPVTPGETYAASVSVMAATGLRPFFLGIVWRTAAGDVAGSATPGDPITPSSLLTPVRPSIVAVAPPGAATMQLVMRAGDARTGDEYWWDGVLVEQSDIVGDYFNGDTKASLAEDLNPRLRAFTGPNDPERALASGEEYVWFQTDGSGNLLDIISGVSS